MHQSDVEVGISEFTFCHIIKDIIGMQKIASQWVQQHLIKKQEWHRYALANLHLEWYYKEGDAFLCHITAADETRHRRMSLN
jgi:hypothetical protein